jgi:hypothetical protein
MWDVTSNNVPERRFWIVSGLPRIRTDEAGPCVDNWLLAFLEAVEKGLVLRENFLLLFQIGI